MFCGKKHPQMAMGECGGEVEGMDTACFHCIQLDKVKKNKETHPKKCSKAVHWDFHFRYSLKSDRIGITHTTRVCSIETS